MWTEEQKAQYWRAAVIKFVGFLLLYFVLDSLCLFLGEALTNAGIEHPFLWMLVGYVVVAALVYIKFKSKVLLVWLAAILGYVFFTLLALPLMEAEGCRGEECTGAIVLGIVLYLLAPASMLFLLTGYAIYAKVRQKKQPGAVWYASALSMILFCVNNYLTGYASALNVLLHIIRN